MKRFIMWLLTFILIMPILVWIIIVLGVVAYGIQDTTTYELKSNGNGYELKSGGRAKVLMPHQKTDKVFSFKSDMQVIVTDAITYETIYGNVVTTTSKPDIGAMTPVYADTAHSKLTDYGKFASVTSRQLNFYVQKAVNWQWANGYQMTGFLGRSGGKGEHEQYAFLPCEKLANGCKLIKGNKYVIHTDYIEKIVEDESNPLGDYALTIYTSE